MMEVMLFKWDKWNSTFFFAPYCRRKAGINWLSMYMKKMTGEPVEDGTILLNFFLDGDDLIIERDHSLYPITKVKANPDHIEEFLLEVIVTLFEGN